MPRRHTTLFMISLTPGKYHNTTRVCTTPPLCSRTVSSFNRCRHTNAISLHPKHTHCSCDLSTNFHTHINLRAINLVECIQFVFKAVRTELRGWRLSSKHKTLRKRGEKAHGGNGQDTNRGTRTRRISFFCSEKATEVATLR